MYGWDVGDILYIFWNVFYIFLKILGLSDNMRHTYAHTYDTERFSGEAEASLPASVTTAAASTPYPDDVLQTKHYNHHKLL